MTETQKRHKEKYFQFQNFRIHWWNRKLQFFAAGRTGKEQESLGKLTVFEAF